MPRGGLREAAVARDPGPAISSGSRVAPAGGAARRGVKIFISLFARAFRAVACRWHAP